MRNTHGVRRAMTPEDVLSALVAHGANVEFRPPDPLVEAVRYRKTGKKIPRNWREVRGDDGKIDRLRSWPAIDTASGRDERRVGKTGPQEVATDALIGMPKRSWQTLQTAIGASVAARDQLFSRLLRAAWNERRRERGWPSSVRRQPCRCRRTANPDYMEDLAQLAILQLEFPVRFGTHDARAVWFGLSNTHWRDTMQRPFDRVSANVWHWYAVGIGHIEHRLNRRRRDQAPATS